MRLGLQAEKVWSGLVCPLSNQFTLYLMLRRAPGESVTAFFRNPASNFGARRMFSVRRDGHKVVLTNINDNKDQLEGTCDETADRLSLRVPMPSDGRKVPVTFDFTRRGRDNATGFFPRTPHAGRYSYRPPVPNDDGWATASLADVRIAVEPAAQAVQKLLLTETKDSSTPYIQGLLVARHGKLVLEEYFYGFDRDRPHDLRSVAKSFTSALVGIAMDRSGRFDLDTPVCSLFPKYKSLANPDRHKERITIKHLLTMTSGLAGDDTDDSSPGNEWNMFTQTYQPDYYKFALDLPMARRPGGDRVVYFSAGINLLAGVVHNATGMSAADFFDTHLAQPLDMRGYHLNLTPTKDLYGGGGLYVRPRDALKLGQVYLDSGLWNGRRVVGKRWVDLSTRRHTGYNREHGYGLAWHLFEVRGGGRTYKEYEAQGNGGQVISVVPELDVAVMFTTGNYDDDETVPEREILSAVISAVERDR